MKRHLLSLLLFTMLSLGLNAQSIGLIGSATPDGWDSDQDMTMMNDSMWTLDITLITGACKFRQDDDWVVNWGSADFPAGIGMQDGADIPVFAGDYTVTFNSNSGAYNFAVSSPIGIIGSSTPNGWDSDTDMYQSDTDPNVFFIEMDLIAGEAKFRQDDDWAVNWGSADFPAGTGELDGVNIPIPADGTYYITMDTSSGAYLFSQDFSYATVGLIGSATPDGWDKDTTMSLAPGSTEDWRLQITLIDGEAKFRADNDWVDNWGSLDFPMGTGVAGGDNIPVTAGEYFVTFNTASGDYNFAEVIEFATVGIIGSATPDAWDSDQDMEKDTDNPHLWKLRLDLVAGEAKFRADDDWAINWGAGVFPEGTATQDGANIPVPSDGDYLVTFNSITGDFTFAEVFEYGTVGIIGKSGPQGEWETDVPLDKDAADFNLWSLAEVTLTDYDAADTDGSGIKFRADNDWGVNWGEVAFPAGTATQDGPNIECVAGTYSVTFNSLTGDYAFGPPSSNTDDLISPSSIVVSPNPTSSLLNIDMQDIVFEGNIKIKVTDMAGRLVMETNMQASSNIQLNVSDLIGGNYLLTITDEKHLVGKRFNVSK